MPIQSGKTFSSLIEHLKSLDISNGAEDVSEYTAGKVREFKTAPLTNNNSVLNVIVARPEINRSVRGPNENGGRGRAVLSTNTVWQEWLKFFQHLYYKTASQVWFYDPITPQVTGKAWQLGSLNNSANEEAVLKLYDDFDGFSDDETPKDVMSFCASDNDTLKIRDYPEQIGPQLRELASNAVITARNYIDRCLSKVALKTNPAKVECKQWFGNDSDSCLESVYKQLVLLNKGMRNNVIITHALGKAKYYACVYPNEILNVIYLGNKFSGGAKLYWQRSELRQ